MPGPAGEANVTVLFLKVGALLTRQEAVRLNLHHRARPVQSGVTGRNPQLRLGELILEATEAVWVSCGNASFRTEGGLGVSA